MLYLQNILIREKWRIAAISCFELCNPNFLELRVFKLRWWNICHCRTSFPETKHRNRLASLLLFPIEMSWLITDLMSIIQTNKSVTRRAIGKELNYSHFIRNAFVKKKFRSYSFSQEPLHCIAFGRKPSEHSGLNPFLSSLNLYAITTTSFNKPLL